MSRLSVAVWTVAAMGTVACAVVASRAVAAGTTSTSLTGAGPPATVQPVAAVFSEGASFGGTGQSVDFENARPLRTGFLDPTAFGGPKRRPIRPPRAQGRREPGAALRRLERPSRRSRPLIPRIQRIPPISGNPSINRLSTRFEGVSIRSSTSATRFLGRAGRRLACREPGRPPSGSPISRGPRRAVTAARLHRREIQSRSQGFASGRPGTSRTQDVSSRRNV